MCCFLDWSFLCDGYFWLVLAAPKSILACIRMRFSSDRMPRTFVLKLIYIYIDLYVYIYRERESKARSSQEMELAQDDVPEQIETKAISRILS